MNKNVPRTPFSTQLSGSAKETELRLRNLFSGPKKRPPLLLILLTALAILLCGNLVAFRPMTVAPTLVMETQYYDSYENYIEIPALGLPAGERNDAVDAINAALNDLRDQYRPLFGGPQGEPSLDDYENHCLFYPSTTDRYLNLVFFRSRMVTDLNTGHVLSFVYDRKDGALVTAAQALALAGLNEKALLDQVTEQLEPEMNPQGQDYRIALHNLTLEGFRIKADGQPVFYLTGRMDDVDDDVLDAVSGGEHLYIWDNRTVATYDQYGLEPAPLVPADETDRLDPPLWNQWYFAGGEPAGGFIQVEAPLPAPQLYDPEVALLRDGGGEPLGPPLSLEDSFLEPMIAERYPLTDYAPIYGEGDYWLAAHGDQIISRSYYSAAEGNSSLYLLDVSRSDFYTPRGIRVGDSREAVLAAYPEIYDAPYWDYGGDYLWYCSNAEGWGSAIIFFFYQDQVTGIQLHHVID